MYTVLVTLCFGTSISLGRISPIRETRRGESTKTTMPHQLGQWGVAHKLSCYSDSQSEE